ncbi:unnamed protein product [Lupinus luteus]|uniref:Uncharacterized protein n=1 Tax=Lupinus luteus TaxID=3873 RepID=A0AAV1Y8N5_LUPLU
MDVCDKQNGIIKCVKLNNDVSEPITPDTVRQNADSHSPLTLSPQTPKDAIFDPDDDDDDDDDDDAQSLSDEDMFESVYQNLLQVILSKQTEEGILSPDPHSNVAEYDSDDCKTPPPSSLLLLEELNTCPHAPIKLKPGDKRRNNFQLGLCKKLEF